MADLLRLPARDREGAIHVVVESPRHLSRRRPRLPRHRVVRITQDGQTGPERNDRLVVVPVKAPRTDGISDARQLGPDDAARLVEEAERRT